MGKYANIMLDDWFKRAFSGSENGKKLLSLFLQELIPERKIVSLTYEPQENINPFPGKKDVRVDVECTDADGSRFVVEMQVTPQNWFYERALYYSSFSLMKQMDKGIREYDFPPVYFIGLMNFSLHEGTDQVLYRYSLREDSSGERMTDRLHYIFLELPNCKKALSKDATTLDNFCYAMSQMENLTSRPAALKSEMFNLLFDSADFSKFTAEEKIKYDKDMTTERDRANQLDYAKQLGLQLGMQQGMQQGMQRGMQQGMQQGMQLGEEKAMRRVVENMLRKKMSLESISELSGLSIDSIKQLQSDKV